MPLYELVLILRQAPKQDIVDCLKRTANLIWKERGVLKKMEFMGYQKLPWSAGGQNEGEKYHEGNYFLYHVSISNDKLFDIRPELRLDREIIRSKFNLCQEKKNEEEEEDYECTLEEELLPPALRQSVRPLLENKNVRASVRR